ncbi:hypothetical protein [Azospirillum sp. A29]|uniref:hypothetical protein n=1 Tax=Azospirillum sp. A29 TaxID=3160606 RepID=UPI00366A758F
MTVMTAHARLRIDERGISPVDIETVLTWGRELPVGGGARSVTLSRHAAAELAAEGTPRSQINALRRMAVVVAADGDVMTALWMWRSKRSRRYRRGIR